MVGFGAFAASSALSPTPPLALSRGERARLVTPHPQVFWEDGIVSGYRRPTSSALDCVLSSFQMTNETVNIWTHFLPTW